MENPIRPGVSFAFGEQLQSDVRKAAVRKKKAQHKSNANFDAQKSATAEAYDPLIPALTLFASGLPLGQERIKAYGLLSEPAEALCIEKNIPLGKA